MYVEPIFWTSIVSSGGKRETGKKDDVYMGRMGVSFRKPHLRWKEQGQILVELAYFRNLGNDIHYHQGLARLYCKGLQHNVMKRRKEKIFHISSQERIRSAEQR